MEFGVPAENDTYIDTDFKIYIRGKLVSGDGKDLDNKDFTAVTNNFLHSLFSQCSITLNGVPITQASELYQYRSYLETLLTYGSDAATSHLTNAFWYLDDGDMLPCDLTAEKTATTNKGFITRWDRIKQSKEIQLSGRFHSDFYNVPLYLVPGVRIQIKLTKARPSFYLMNKTADSKTHFKFLDAQLIVKRVKPHPNILIAHHTTLEKKFFARYNFTRVELQSFTFSSRSKSLSIDNAVLGPIPKRLLLTMVKNSDLNGSLDSNPFNLKHYDINHFTLFVSGKQVPNEGLTLGMDHEKTSVMGYNSLFEGSGIYHSNAGLQITHDMYINGFFVTL